MSDRGVGYVVSVARAQDVRGVVGKRTGMERAFAGVVACHADAAAAVRVPYGERVLERAVPAEAVAAAALVVVAPSYGVEMRCAVLSVLVLGVRSPYLVLRRIGARGQAVDVEADVDHIAALALFRPVRDHYLVVDLEGDSAGGGACAALARDCIRYGVPAGGGKAG